MAQAKQMTVMTVDFRKFNPNALKFTILEDNDRSKGQRIAYPRYNDGPLMLQCPWTQITTGGVPRIGEYYPEDKDRAFVKVPLDTETNSDFIKVLTDLDKQMSNAKYKEELLGKKHSKYSYIPIVRFPQDDDDEEASAKPPHIKLKIDTTWPDYNVKTLVYRSEMKNGKRERTKMDVTTIDEFAEHVRYMANCRFIIRPVKLWAHPEKKKDPQYGITWKIIKAECEPLATNSGSLSSYYNNDAFLDSDDEEAQEATKGEAVEDSEDESEDDSDSDSSEDAAPPSPVLKKKGGRSKKNHA